MGSNPAVMGSLMPGANVSGSSVAVPPTPMSYGSQSIGGNTNPFLPVPTSGQSVALVSTPSTSSPSPMTAPGTLGGSNLYDLWGGGPNSGVPGDTGQSLKGLIGGLKATGIPGGIASVLAGFLQSGAGFNPKVAEALINAMGPSIERGTENIAEQFSAMGNRFGSPAATGFGDFEGQVQLDIGQIFSQLYEQSVSNYLNILTNAGKKQPSAWQGFLQNFAGQAGTNAANILV